MDILSVFMSMFIIKTYRDIMSRYMSRCFAIATVLITSFHLAKLARFWRDK